MGNLFRFPRKDSEMATIHISEIQRILADRGEKDALSWSSDGFFIEIRFDKPGDQVPAGC
jgi:hypothetical protein